MSDSQKYQLSDGCKRSQINAGYIALCLNLLISDDDLRKKAFNLNGDYKKGFRTLGVEVGRYVDKFQHCDREELANFIKASLASGMTFRDIAFYFRGKRLGDRSGNVDALKKMLFRDIENFWKTFPKTSKWEVVYALEQIRHEISITESDEVM